MEIEKPEYIPYIKPLSIGTICFISFGNRKRLKCIINKVMLPGYQFSNTYTWCLRYSLMDFYDKDHSYVVDSNHIKTYVDINGKERDYYEYERIQKETSLRIRSRQLQKRKRNPR